MARQWVQKHQAIVLTPVLLGLALVVACGASATATPARPAATPQAAVSPGATVPVANPSPTPAPTSPPKAQVAILKAAISPLPNEGNIPWEESGGGTLDERPYLEHLIDVDQVTIQVKPMLATKWEMSPDGKTWTLQLRKGVPFHFGYGEFTGADLVHSLERITSESSISTQRPDWRRLLGNTPDEMRQNVKVVDRYQVVFNLKTPSLTLASFQMTAWTYLFMLSKDQWDKEGIEGLRRRPTGTGAYQYKERKPGEYIRYERVDNHWRQTPEFKELELRFPPEDATRIAMLLAGEVHLADIPRSLQKDAVARGMKLIPTRVPIANAAFIMGGLYFTTPDKYDANIPWTKREVREALNRAINRKEVQQTIFEGQGEPMYVSSYYHPTLEGYNKDWEKQFEDKYGYNPDKAKQLISQAGYPKGFKVKLISAAVPGLTELPQLVEAMDIYLRRIGLNVEIEQMEYARLRDLFRNKNAHGLIWAQRGNYFPSEQNIVTYNHTKEKGTQGFNDQRIDDKLEAFQKSIDQAERERLLREMGQIKFEEYDGIPLFWLKVNATVNPTVIGEYNFGTVSGVFSHWEYIKPPQ